MNKVPIIRQILKNLDTELANAKEAAEQARLAATDEQSVAETQYDTLAIEAGFLAHGQSQRADELIIAIESMEKLAKQDIKTDAISLGNIVTLLDENNTTHHFYMAPVAGGMTLKLEGLVVTVITPKAPLGQLLLSKHRDDEVVLTVANTTKEYIVEAID
ncbi:hypothetical protein tloyanaT_33980 [Thalassotalea loyana]|uniref:Transcription elongation factor GreAB n=1 Tax=Thalassotalea loyana TaxID=280483 RepID=A0ABQ6HJE8_9GAMM|nr:transcription elongation factor GreAB [Thalassotalea loyana]GLX87145.1 hypothetical protein tloyanaT_33980 [Thalassotalea loyana]